MSNTVELDFERPQLYPMQQAAIFDPRRYSVIEASAQPLDCAIQTPSGPRRFGDLVVGDKVFSVDGSVTKVTGVFPKGKQSVYRIRFIDGAETRASADHLWAIDHYRDGPRVMTTAQILALTSGSRQHLRFPIAEAAQYRARPVGIDPWLLGVLLGDGCVCSNALSVSTADPEIVERVRAAIPKGYSLNQASKYCWNIVATVRGAGYERPSIRFKLGGYEVSIAQKYIGRRATLGEAESLHAEFFKKHYGEDVPELNLRKELRRLGLMGLRHNEKFVPEEYLRNSIEVRQEVLRGIMDTDGSGGRANNAVIEQTSERLAANIRELVFSLGGISRTAVTPPRREGWKTSYRTNIRHNQIADVFWLERKRKRAPSLTRVVRKISSIERIEDAEVQCISVEHASQLYLTDDWIVTHNTKAGKTAGSIVWLTEQALRGADGDHFWWVAPVSGQADIAFRRTLRALPPDIATHNLTSKTITLINGPIMWFKSGDKPDLLYGEDVKAAVVDEASRVKEEAWFAVRSTLTHTRGPVRIIGNVKGRKNWFYKMARIAEGGGRENMGYHRIVAADAVAAGVLSADEIEDARAQLPEHVFQELYLAKAADDDGNPFGITHIARCTSDLSTNPPALWGWDLAKKQDWTVGIALDAQSRVCRYVRFQKPWEDTIAEIKKQVSRLPALIDSTGVGDPIVEMLQKTPGTKFEGFHFTSQSKQKIMEGLAVAIQSGAVTFPKGQIVDELEEFAYEYTRTGVRYSAPEGFTDDCVCALALAVYHRGHAPVGYTIPESAMKALLAMPKRPRLA